MSDKKKKVLIVTYYWPPSGGAGVHRWLKMSKYLSVNNSCIVYTPLNPDFALMDETLTSKVSPHIKILKKKIFEPYFIYKIFLNKEKRKNVNTPSSISGANSLLKKFAVWIRGNIFIPDPRVFWVKPSSKYLLKVIKKEKIDTVITTGPPHSMHLIGLKIKKKLGDNIHWITDFRDPWTNIDFYDKLNISKRADKKHRVLEKKVVTNCDTLVTVSQSWSEEFKNLGASNVKVITNGFEPSNYKFDNYESKKFCITHIGSINSDRNPKSLWAAISDLCNQNKDFKDLIEIKLVGNINEEVLKSIREFKLDSILNVKTYLPHSEALNELHESSISLLLLNNTKNIDGIIPGKLFEYMGVGNPILAVGKKNGDSGNIIYQNKLGEVAPFNDVEAAKVILHSFFEKFQNNLLQKTTHDKLEKFTIEKLSASFEKIF